QQIEKASLAAGLYSYVSVGLEGYLRSQNHATTPDSVKGNVRVVATAVVTESVAKGGTGIIDEWIRDATELMVEQVVDLRFQAERPSFRQLGRLEQGEVRGADVLAANVWIATSRAVRRTEECRGIVVVIDPVNRTDRSGLAGD